ncbi:MAG: uroporphyrinogen-III synthase [Cryomorphaceae bacterium]|nr:uroporphyrinogen-III synthase [Cryomorphaceae bacterium]
MKVKTILVSQPEPASDVKSPYEELATKQKLKIDFRPFIHVEGVEATDFRKEKINLADFSAVIFTSRNAIDHFFRMCEECRHEVPIDLKYFCVSEAIAFYLQKYVVYRKRKIYYGKLTFPDLVPILKKHKTEKFLLPTSDVLKADVPKALDTLKVDYTRAVLYRTVCSDLSDLEEVKYDILVFFSPSGIKSLFENFPDFVQGETRIAGFGATTHKAITEAGLRLDIGAPTPEAPSMTMALENYIKEANKR